MEFILSLLEVIMLPCLCMLILSGVEYIKARNDQLQHKTYLEDALDAIYKSVMKVNQTYVDALKSQGNFTADAQATAYKTAWSTALQMMGQDVVAHLENTMDDFALWLEVQIEAAVNANK